LDETFPCYIRGFVYEMLSCYTYNNAQIIEICPTPVKFSGEINFLKKVSSKNVKHFKVIQQH